MPSRGSLDIWLVQTGEELPTDPGPPRLLRTALLAEQLATRGHRVTYWNAAFNHQQKILRTVPTTETSVGGRYQAILLRGRPYGRNISVSRIMSQRDNARAFAAEARRRPPPDVILCGMPTIELADQVVSYANKHAVPVAVDCRDMWPDVIRDHMRRPVRTAITPVLRHWTRLRDRALRRATALTGISEPFVAWGAACAGRSLEPRDRVFPLTFASAAPPPAALASARAFWDEILANVPAGAKIGAFAGTMSARLDVMTIARGAAALSPAERSKVHLVFCGRGDIAAELEALCAAMPHMTFAGWQSASSLHALMTRATFGILPYPQTPDFDASYPNKLGEYLSFGLATMTGMGGISRELLSEHGLLLPYVIGDPASVTQALSALPDDAESWKVRQRRARALYAERFDPDTVMPRFADFLETLSESSSTA